MEIQPHEREVIPYSGIVAQSGEVEDSLLLYKRLGQEEKVVSAHCPFPISQH